MIYKLFEPKTPTHYNCVTRSMESPVSRNRVRQIACYCLPLHQDCHRACLMLRLSLALVFHSFTKRHLRIDIRGIADTHSLFARAQGWRFFGGGLFAIAKHFLALWHGCLLDGAPRRALYEGSIA